MIPKETLIGMLLKHRSTLRRGDHRLNRSCPSSQSRVRLASDDVETDGQSIKAVSI
jgi:hypothetical protein